jgi:hypothetical protein
MAAALPGEIYLTTDVATAMCPTERVSRAEKSDLVLDCSRRPLCLVLKLSGLSPSMGKRCTLLNPRF